MFITIDVKTALKVAAIAILLTAFILVIVAATGGRLSDAFAGDTGYTLVLDPGHGGVDGGAVSENGIKESDINLAIALKTEAAAQLLGIDTVMTRSTDTDNSDGAYSERGNLLRRAEMANSTPNAVLISIHQNTFPTDKVRGAEVMYARSPGSEELGTIIQDKLVRQVDPSNRRVAIPAPKKLLLTSSVTCPAVLVECGFLSNADEARLLASDEYQTKLALAFAASFIQFVRQE